MAIWKPPVSCWLAYSTLECPEALPWHCNIVVEILLVRLRVAKSLKNLRLQRMNQISLITRSVEGRPKRSLPNSQMLPLKYKNREEVTFIYNKHKS